ncbi:two component transcriptional regulator, winged helix family [Gemmobacter megaterium]|uniref:Two component transcriptional regulator, winged helix family n=1 Tax=Gemmobacter megaterium TaxID=1086013 RepID=A0A1N7KT85_9RHOB|nr:response regulator [Gemmobacter megaterium]GGE03680.1 DNA-binding response regulator [Gemmobacter megaterium]SIS64809.1 two component transcriptional regulator, winged helix family [Gemmobacter megaterium]
MTDSAPLHLLVVDDDDRIRGLLQKFLIRHNYLVSVATDAARARRLLGGLDFDLIVMDVMMPGEDGVSLTRALRDQGVMIPILLLTARGEAESRIDGLEAGADDYLVKPFEPRELLLRINAILRRIPQPLKPAAITARNLTLGPLRYDVDRAELWLGDQPIRLTTTEIALMRIFAARAGEVVGREKLVAELGGDEAQASERAVDVQITRLRRKIEPDPKQPRYLQTIRGEGYRLAPD